MSSKYYYMVKANVYETLMFEQVHDYDMAQDAFQEAACVLGSIKGNETFILASVLAIIAAYGGYKIGDLNSSPFQKLLETGLVISYGGMLYMKSVWE